MRAIVTGVAALALLAGCTVVPAPGITTSTPGTTGAGSPATSASPPGTSFEPTPTSPTPTPSTSPTEADSTLETAFAHPESGGIAAFLGKHPEYLPAMVVIGDDVASGSAKGPIELGLRNVPPGTNRMYMTIACTESRPYRMELTRADGSSVGASWGDSCGYWGGLNGYATSAFDPDTPPTRFTITVPADVRYSYVLYASPKR